MMAEAGAESNPESRETIEEQLEPLKKRLEQYTRLSEIRATPEKKRRMLRMIKDLTKYIRKIEKNPNLRIDPDWEDTFPSLKHEHLNTRTPPAGQEDDATDGSRQASGVDYRSGNRGPTFVDSTDATTGRGDTTRLHYIYKAVDDTPNLHIKRARVLMLINVDFDNLANRDEALEDRSKLEGVLIETLGYENFFYEALNDKTKYGITDSPAFRGIEEILTAWTEKQMIAIIESLANTPYDGDALMLFIGSHGTCRDGRDVVTGIDTPKNGKGIMIDEIITILDNGHTSIKNVPKFVFIQACRGKKHISTIEVPVAGGVAQLQSTEGITYDPLPTDMDLLTLEETSEYTADAPSSHTLDAINTHLGSQSEGGTLANQSSRNPTPHNLHVVATIDTDTNQALGEGAGMNISESPFPGIPRAAEAAISAARILTPAERNVSLPRIPDNFLLVYSAPKGCLSGRIPKESFNPVLRFEEGSIFTQTFAMHLQACLEMVGESNSGIALLPLLIGVQNEVSWQCLEIGVIEHRLTKQPILGRNR